MYLTKVSSLKKGQYFYEPDTDRHFYLSRFSRENDAYYAVEIMTYRKVLFDCDELVCIPF